MEGVMARMIDAWHDRYHNADSRDYGCPHCQDEVMTMAWETEFTGETPGKRPRRVEYQTRVRRGHSHAERADRVLLSGEVVHTGWVGDHRGYKLYKSLTTEWYATEDRGIHNPLCPHRVFHSNPAHVCEEVDESNE